MPLRIIQVGLGGWGQDWLANIVTKSEDFELVACVDVNGAMLARAQASGIAPERCFGTVEQALDAVESDAVLVTATLPSHVPLALAALNAGRHVLVEKPFAPSIEEAQQVINTAAARGRVVMVSQNYRFYPAVRAVMTLLREGTLGPINTVAIDFRRYANQAPVDGHRHYTLTQPLLMDMAIHHFDLMRGVLGQEPATVACTAWNPPWSKFAEPPSAVAAITFDGGAVVSYRGSWISTGPATPWAGEWRIECESGEIAWASRANTGLKDDRVTVRPMGKRARRVELPTLAHIDRAGALHAFAEAIHTGGQPETAGTDNTRSLALMHAAIDAATTNKPVHLR